MLEANSPLEREISHYNFSFPILKNLSAYLAESGSLKNRKIAWHCHLTSITAASARVLLQAGAELFMSECNPNTTDAASVELMKHEGAKVYLGSDSTSQTLAHRPEIISDTGFVLTSEYLNECKNGANYLHASCEITSSGIQKLRLREDIKFPVININDGTLKTQIENFHGVGDGVMSALTRVCGRLWGGRNAAVVGYGAVGAGVAEHLKRAGASVKIVENDPVRRLVAHYDGFALASISEALSSSELVVTATGSKSVIGAAEFPLCSDSIILMNVGHWPEEIDVSALMSLSHSHRRLSEHLEEYELHEAGKKIYLAGGAGPANVVMLSGSPEPTLIHLSTEILCMKHLLGGKSLTAGENPVPPEVERQVSILALRSLGLEMK